MSVLGAIIGDISGSTREFEREKLSGKDDVVLLPPNGFFTDDSVMTCAVGNTVRRWLALPGEEQTEERFKAALVTEMQTMGMLYPGRGYGRRFAGWLEDPDPTPYHSLGNGSAMRVSSVSFLARSREECERLARWSAEVTHNHPEGVKGAVCTAALGFLARTEKDKSLLRAAAAEYYPELSDPSFTVAWLYDTYQFTEWCQHTVPQAVECFLEADSFAETIVNCIYIGGDCDTSAAIAGGIAEAYYGIPEELKNRAVEMLTQDDAAGDLVSAVQGLYRENGSVS